VVTEAPVALTLDGPGKGDGRGKGDKSNYWIIGLIPFSGSSLTSRSALDLRESQGAIPGTTRPFRKAVIPHMGATIRHPSKDFQQRATLRARGKRITLFEAFHVCALRFPFDVNLPVGGTTETRRCSRKVTSAASSRPAIEQLLFAGGKIMTGKFKWTDKNRRNYTVDADPEVCPLCHYAIAAQQLGWAVTERQTSLMLELVCRCPRSDCGRHFIARYEAKRPRHPSPDPGHFVMIEAVPRLPEPPFVPEEIGRISPLFVEIMSEASAGEAYGLKQLVGVGYRKALEFLVKDYCIYTRPADEMEITKVQLSDCIKRFVDDQKIKDCAKRAAWLGNDETHYERKWADKAIGDLKILIDLTVVWIQSCELTKQYQAEMS
jgi:hypothetical protein